jgi:uncharacterized protein YehS (DUF1456 family)
MTICIDHRTVMMKNNLILRKITLALSLELYEVKSILADACIDLDNRELTGLLHEEDDVSFAPLPDSVLILFLNGLIDKYRGKREGAVSEPASKPEKISNNLILKKLRIALNFQEQDLREALKLVTIELTKSDLSALFRKAGQAQYKSCDDELLMDFIAGFGKLLQQRKSEAE